MCNRLHLLSGCAVILSLAVVTSYSAVGRQVPAPSASRTQIVLRGTGTPRADPQRSGPATAIVVNDTPYLVDAHDVEPGLIYQESSVKVNAFPVSHGELQACGYRFQTPDRTVVISGDTSPSPALIDSCQKCGILIHEAFSEDYTPADMANWL